MTLDVIRIIHRNVGLTFT